MSNDYEKSNENESTQEYKTYGVTPPISVSPPTEKELKYTETLIETLKKFGLFESEEDARKRYWNLLICLYDINFNLNRY